MFIVGHQSLTQAAISRCNIHFFTKPMKIMKLVIGTMTSNVQRKRFYIPLTQNNILAFDDRVIFIWYYQRIDSIAKPYFRKDNKHMIICANIHIDELLSDYNNQTMYSGFCRKFSVMHLG